MRNPTVSPCLGVDDEIFAAAAMWAQKRVRVIPSFTVEHLQYQYRFAFARPSPILLNRYHYLYLSYYSAKPADRNTTTLA
jgi:hypothetical protein